MVKHCLLALVMLLLMGCGSWQMQVTKRQELAEDWVKKRHLKAWPTCYIGSRQCDVTIEGGGQFVLNCFEHKGLCYAPPQ